MYKKFACNRLDHVAEPIQKFAKEKCNGTYNV